MKIQNNKIIISKKDRILNDEKLNKHLMQLKELKQKVLSDNMNVLVEKVKILEQD